jgi:peroxiredoxin
MANPGGRWISYVLLIVGVAAAAFLGVLAGTEYIEWRKAGHYQNKVDSLQAGESSLLRQGDAFPVVELVGLDGTATDTRAVSNGRYVLYLFVAVGCEPCTEALQAWADHQADLPADIKIYGLSEDKLEAVRAYVQQIGFAYPVYCDTNYMFSSEYDMNIYPSIIGTRPEGTIAFVQHGISRDFSVSEAVKRLKGQ